MVFRILVNGLSLGSVYAVIAVGYALIFNILKFSNFSHGSVMTVCAYLGYFFSLQVRNYVSLPVLIAVTAVFCVWSGAAVGLVVERMAFWELRRKNTPVIYYFISSITMSILLENIVNIFASTNFYSYPFSSIASRSIRVGEIYVGVMDLLMITLSLLLLFVLMYVIFRTKVGTAMRAVSMDASTAGLMGIDVNTIVLGTFIVAGMLAGVSGMFLAIKYTLYPQLGRLVVKGFIASVIGGLGSITGALIGAVLLGLMEITLINLIGSGYAPVFSFVIMLVFLILRPQGIAGIIIQEKA
jgi:branched-chain amino acid transport system permease protein